MAELLDISVLNDISAFWPQSEQIKSHIQGVETHFAANKHACLDSAKCLLESVCKTIIREHNHSIVDDKGNDLVDKVPLQRLFSEAMSALGIRRTMADDIETELFNALVKSIEQVGRYRNHYSANGHGRVANCEKLADDMCMMAVSTLLSACLLLFREHHNQSNTTPKAMCATPCAPTRHLRPITMRWTTIPSPRWMPKKQRSCSTAPSASAIAKSSSPSTAKPTPTSSPASAR